MIKYIYILYKINILKKNFVCDFYEKNCILFDIFCVQFFINIFNLMQHEKEKEVIVLLDIV